MRAEVTDVSDMHATVTLTPCWLARVFGSLTLVVDLVRRDGRWVTAGTGRIVSHDPVWDGEDWVGGNERDRLILEAIDFRPRRELPVARALAVPQEPM